MQKLLTVLDWSKTDHRKKLNDYIANLPKDAVFWVEIKKYRKNRSKEQNAYYWSVVVNILAKELGYDPDEMHEILKQKFNSKKETIVNDFFKVEDLDILLDPRIESWVNLVEPEDVKKDSLGNYLIPHAFVKKIPNFEKYGEVVQIEETYQVPITTTASDTYEFSQYVEKIRDWAAMDLNIYIPSPDGA